MPSFLNNVVKDILSKDADLSGFTFIIPSKRAGVFLKDELISTLKHSTILPKILSIEDFIEELSNINSIDTTTLLFEFYSIYKQLETKDSIDSFDNFIKWASLLLNDFNEIDRHLIDPVYIFSYLRDIKRLEKLLEKGEKKTDLIKNYFLFFEKIENYYNTLYHHLLGKKIGYQGLQYKEASENIHFYIENSKDAKLIFIGFNALNKAEETIIQELLKSNIASIYWDIDQTFYNQNHSSSIFIKKYHKNWSYYNNHDLKWIQDNFNKKKNIKIIGAPKNTSQIKYAGEILSNLKSPTDNFKNTALVLADESLLTTALNSLPDEVEHVNITMGYELKNIPLANLFEQIFKLHINKRVNKFYYKDILALLDHFQLKAIFKDSLFTERLRFKISSNNYPYITKPELLKLINEEEDNFEIISFLFDNWNESVKIAIENCIKLIDLIRKNTNLNMLEKEYLFRFYTIFQQLSNLIKLYNHIDNIKTLYQVYRQILQYEKLSFKGEPLSGLQIMGTLETRELDFKNIIITSVNEGVLPAGKSDNSFIPFDVKKEVGLPTYQEKDAIFSYHFFRLLQRAENIFLIYNTESNQYGSGEQSRFLTQLEILKENEIEKIVVSPSVNKSKIPIKHISKNEKVLDDLKQLAKKGFSPTTLTTYILNPFEFYKQKILKINEVEEVEETIAANTLGTIIHKTLEALYLPVKGKFLKEDHIALMTSSASKEVEKWFVKEYKNGNLTSGKNHIIFNVAKQFVQNFLDQELITIQQGKQIKILELEYDLKLLLPIEGLDFPVQLVGQVDRIDQLDGVTRIIDYKTGKATQTQLTVNDWSLLTTDYTKYSKSFQVLFYALLYVNTKLIDIDSITLESGIISFKNLKSGFLKVNKRNVTSEDLANFTNELKQLILEIFDPGTLILEKEVSFKR
ncbi:MAG: PD-(D/E)XK nuclease family protein [Aureibaculum sp.]